MATYETTVTLSAAELQNKRIWLDFGEGTRVAEYPMRNGYRTWLDGPIREAAWVDVNGGRVVGRHLGAAVPHGHHAPASAPATTASASASATPR